MKKWRLPAILLLALALLLATGGTLAAQTPTPTPAPAKIEGKISSVDLQAKKITITPGQRPAVTLIVTANTKIEVWGKEPAVLEDLKVGHGVEATYNSATMEAIEIEAKSRGEPSLGARQGFFGTVKSIATASITLDTKQGAVVLTVNADTEYWIPPKKDATLSDVKAGDRVAVVAEKPDATLLAKRVLVLPTKPLHEQIKGVVTKISGTEITITDDTGKTVVADAPPGVARKIEVGDLVTAVIIKTPGVEKVILKDIESSDKLLERLRRQAEKMAGKDKDEIERMIERNRHRHEEMLQGVLAKAPEAAKAGIQKAIEKSRARGRASEAPGQGAATPGKASEAPGQGAATPGKASGGKER